MNEPRATCRWIARSSIEPGTGHTVGFHTDIEKIDAEVYCNRAVVRMLTRDLDGALKDNARAIKLNPALSPAYCNRGTLYEAKGDVPRAIADYTKAIQLSPAYVEAYQNRAAAWRSMGQLTRSLGDWTRIIELAPGSAVAYANRGLVLLVQGNKADAQRDFDHCVSLDQRLEPKVERLIREGAGISAALQGQPFALTFNFLEY